MFTVATGGDGEHNFLKRRLARHSLVQLLYLHMNKWRATLDPRTHTPCISYEAAHMYGGTDLDYPGTACPVVGDIFLARVVLLKP